jgi:hypothetical protein
MLRLLCFAAGSLLSFVVASYVVVYIVGAYDTAWGQSGVFQLLCVVSLFPAGLLTIGLGGLVVVSVPQDRPHISFILGICSSGSLLAFLWLVLGVLPALVSQPCGQGGSLWSLCDKALRIGLAIHVGSEKSIGRTREF